MKKQYIGDGVYASTDGYHIILTTENGITATNTIYLDQFVFSALIGYEASLRAASAAAQETKKATEADAR